jgi:hypothetical protein
MSPLAIIGTEVFMPAIGLSASAAVMLTMLPPDFRLQVENADLGEALLLTRLLGVPNQILQRRHSAHRGLP